MKKITTTELIAMKARGEKIAALTAYEYIFASILDEIGIDLILVGDSLGTVFAGYQTTVEVTLEQMLYHTKVVSRSVKNALVVGDMPFMSFQVTPEEALRNAGRFLQEAGAEAVKLEGGEEIAATIKRIVDAGIPVMGHLGLTPQSIHKFGGYDVRAREEKEAEKLVKDAKILEDSGVFSIVLEKIPHQLARKVSQSLTIPTVGIGAGPYCDGQILVTHDMLGLFERFRPKFVRRYAELARIAKEACSSYVKDVKAGAFPSREESF
ncbi:MAG TPA: 3-methyl-2-oxobutanoate hydroxymethyltransferase [Candidatus Latescibacteria bacterium]|nr:3-methyl-2-oxobutanoate hydroxymethyltransferase [Candidatus Latescibacterota bacterium]